MNERSLEISYWNGKPIAAYLYLPRREGDRSARVEEAGNGLVIDYAPDGRAIGVEIVTPPIVTLEALNSVLARLNPRPMIVEETRPLAA